MTKFIGPFLVFCLAAVGAMSAWKIDWVPPSFEEFEDGATQLSFEDAFGDSLIISDISIQSWNAFKYAMFGETLSGAVAGRDNWLFSSEEYQVADDFDAVFDQSLDFIVSSIAQIEAAGSNAIVVLIPDKARMESDRTSRTRPDILNGRYDRAVRELSKAGISVLDPRKELLSAQKSAPIFLERDTHWTPYGAHVVAKLVGPKIAEIAQSQSVFETKEIETISHQGDLLKFADSGRWNDRLGLIEEDVQLHKTTQMQSGDLSAGLFGDVSIPATLIGTSFSAIPKWNFAGFLMQESTTDILNKAEQGQGPFTPMAAYLNEIEARAGISDVVIWEIPERYLTVEAKE